MLRRLGIFCKGNKHGEKQNCVWMCGPLKFGCSGILKEKKEKRVMVFALLLHLWCYALFKAIGYACGGFKKVEADESKDASKVIISVKEGGVVPMSILVNDERLSYRVYLAEEKLPELVHPSTSLNGKDENSLVKDSHSSGSFTNDRLGSLQFGPNQEKHGMPDYGEHGKNSFLHSSESRLKGISSYALFKGENHRKLVHSTSFGGKRWPEKRKQKFSRAQKQKWIAKEQTQSNFHLHASKSNPKNSSSTPAILGISGKMASFEKLGTGCMMGNLIQ